MNDEYDDGYNEGYEAGLDEGESNGYEEARVEYEDTINELLELLETIENDDGCIPEWLWKRIQSAINKVGKK